MLKRLTIAAMLLIGAAVLWQLRGAAFSGDSILPQEQRSGGRPAIGVITTQVVFTENDISFEALGTGRAQNSIEVYPAVSEEVQKVAFTAGQLVEAGTLLVQLDDRAEQLALDLAKVELKEARGLLERYNRAVKDGAVPESEVDSARAAVEAAKVALAQAELALRERRLLAPFRGVVGIPRVDPGDRVTPTTLITGLDNRETLLVDFGVPEMLAGSLNMGQRIRASTPAFPGREFVGTVSALESRVDNRTRTLLTRAEINNTHDLLRPGMSFALTLEIPGESFPTVPEIAVQWGQDGAFIWAVRSETAEQVPVSIISRSAGTVRIDGALGAGEHVVVEGLQRLELGRTVSSLGTIPNPAQSNPTAETTAGSEAAKPKPAAEPAAGLKALQPAEGPS